MWARTHADSQQKSWVLSAVMYQGYFCFGFLGGSFLSMTLLQSILVIRRSTCACILLCCTANSAATDMNKLLACVVQALPSNHEPTSQWIQPALAPENKRDCVGAEVHHPCCPGAPSVPKTLLCPWELLPLESPRLSALELIWPEMPQGPQVHGSTHPQGTVHPVPSCHRYTKAWPLSLTQDNSRGPDGVCLDTCQTQLHPGCPLPNPASWLSVRRCIHGTLQMVKMLHFMLRIFLPRLKTKLLISEW